MSETLTIEIQDKGNVSQSAGSSAPPRPPAVPNAPAPASRSLRHNPDLDEAFGAPRVPAAPEAPSAPAPASLPIQVQAAQTASRFEAQQHLTNLSERERDELFANWRQAMTGRDFVDWVADGLTQALRKAAQQAASGPAVAAPASAPASASLPTQPPKTQPAPASAPTIARAPAAPKATPAPATPGPAVRPAAPAPSVTSAPVAAPKITPTPAIAVPAHAPVRPAAATAAAAPVAPATAAAAAPAAPGILNALAPAAQMLGGSLATVAVAAAPAGIALAAVGAAVKITEGAFKLVGQAAEVAGQQFSMMARNNYAGMFVSAMDLATKGAEKIPVVGGLLGSAIGAATQSVKAFSSVVSAFDQRASELAQFSPAIAMAEQRSAMRSLFDDIREAQDLGPGLERMLDAETTLQHDMREIFLPIKKVVVETLAGFLESAHDWMPAIRDVLVGLLDLCKSILDIIDALPLNPLADLGAKVSEAIPKITKALANIDFNTKDDERNVDQLGDLLGMEWNMANAADPWRDAGDSRPVIPIVQAFGGL